MLLLLFFRDSLNYSRRPREQSTASQTCPRQSSRIMSMVLPYAFFAYDTLETRRNLAGRSFFFVFHALLSTAMMSPRPTAAAPRQYAPIFRCFISRYATVWRLDLSYPLGAHLFRMTCFIDRTYRDRS